MIKEEFLRIFNAAVETKFWRGGTTGDTYAHITLQDGRRLTAYRIGVDHYAIVPDLGGDTVGAMLIASKEEVPLLHSHFTEMYAEREASFLGIMGEASSAPAENV